MLNSSKFRSNFQSVQNQGYFDPNFFYTDQREDIWKSFRCIYHSLVNVCQRILAETQKNQEQSYVTVIWDCLLLIKRKVALNII